MSSKPTGIFYDDLNLSFPIGKYICSVSKLSFEQQKRSFPSHSHGSNSWELHFVTGGRGSITLDHLPYETKKDIFFITGPHIEHSQISNPDDPVTEYCIYLKFQQQNQKGVQNPTFLERFLETPSYIGNDRQNIPVLLGALFREISDQSIGYRSVITALIMQILVCSVRNFSHMKDDSQNQSADPESHIFLMIEECFLYEYQTLTLSSLARRISLSPRQTERLLMSHYQKTFLQKKTEAKMSAAAILLSNPALSVTEVSLQLGYSSVEHFSGAFRKYYQLSPRAWRVKKRK